MTSDVAITPERSAPTTRDFRNAYRHGFARVAAVTTPIVLADPAANAAAVIEQARALDADAVAVAVFPELGLTGYSIDDLLMADTLLDATEHALGTILAASADLLPVLVVGAPLRKGTRVYNCAVVIHRGRILGVAPKSALPNYREFYERRWFAPGDDQRGESLTLRHLSDVGAVPFGPDLLFRAVDHPDLVVFAEVCEDFWVPIPPSAEASLAGATVLLNLSGSPITIGRAADRHLLSASSSARGVAAYAYAAAGQGESTNDVSWDGQTMIYENGGLLAQTERFPHSAQASIADVDVASLASERLRQGSFDDNRRTHSSRVAGFRTIDFTLDAPRGDIGLRRAVDRFPFVPDDAARLAQDCYEAFNIQVSGLEQRMRAIGMPKLVIGVSGGLDSTHALLVCAQAVDRLGLSREHILAFTMPGFATSDHTRSNAWKLGQALGVTFEEIDIKPAATELLGGLSHPFAAGEPVYDVTFENVQAGIRTDFLFRLANQRGGIVVGTGDLSELALGWCTYGVGDQMSHYAVNPGVPKTLMQHLIRWTISTEQFDAHTDEVLQSVLDTEISPELVPAGQDGAVQSTESTIGPYALHDFTLFHTLRRGAPPSKIAFLAEHAWADPDAGTWPEGFPAEGRPSYDLTVIRQWLAVFLRRYFANQFKRTALPNGPKVASGGSLSPRGDWRMPSDARATAWLAELDAALDPVLGPRDQG